MNRSPAGQVGMATTTIDADGVRTASARSAPSPSRRTTRGRPAGGGIVLIAWAIAVLPYAGSAAWAWAHGWTPTGDRALIGLGARIASRGRPPSLGMVSSLGLRHPDGTVTSVHHLGPMQFWALAPTDLLTGSRPIGQLLGVVLVAAGSLALVAWACLRTLGRGPACWVLAAAVLMAYGLGPVVLRDSWNPHIVLMPILAVLTLAMAVAAGHVRALPWLVGAASFVAQTHLSVVLLVVVVPAWAVVAGWLRVRRLDSRSDLWRPLVAAAVVGALCWAAPLYQQVTGGSAGNLGLLVRTTGQEQGRAGPGFVVSRLTSIMRLPPVWTRRIGDVAGFEHPAGLTVVETLLFVGLLALAVVTAWQRREEDPGAAAATATAVVALVAAAANLAITPDYGTLALQYQRWLWPLGLFVWLGLAAGLRPLLARPARRVGLSASSWAPTAVAVGIVVTPLALIGQGFPVSDGWADRATVRSVATQVEARLPPGQTYLEFLGARASTNYGPEVMRRLLVAGRSIRVPPQYAASMFGRWTLPPTGRPTRTLAIVSNAHTLVTAQRPLAVVGVGIDDPVEGEAWSQVMTRVLRAAPTDGRIEVRPSARAAMVEERERWRPDGAEAELASLLAHPARAVLDRQILRALADGLATSPDVSPSAARRLAPVLDRATWVAVVLAPPVRTPQGSGGRSPD